jgi:hypothetical protein
MPNFLAIFFSVDGVPTAVGLYTTQEYEARVLASGNRTVWAVLLDTSNGNTVRSFINKDAQELEKSPLDSDGRQE